MFPQLLIHGLLEGFLPPALFVFDFLHRSFPFFAAGEQKRRVPVLPGLLFVKFDQRLRAEVAAALLHQFLTVGQRLMQYIQVQTGRFRFLLCQLHVFYKVLHEEAGGEVAVQNFFTLKIQLPATSPPASS